MSVTKWSRKETGKAFARAVEQQHGCEHPVWWAARKLARTGRQADMDAMLETAHRTMTDAQMDALSEAVEALTDAVEAQAAHIDAENEAMLRRLRGEVFN